MRIGNLIDRLEAALLPYTGTTSETLSDENRAGLRQGLSHALEAGRGILHMVLPAFPFKSSNRIEKVLGSNADYAEVVGLETLSRLCNEVNDIVHADISIVSDGHVFNDLLPEIDDEEVDAYHEQIKALHPSSQMSFKKLKDIWKDRSLAGAPMSVQRRYFVENYAAKVAGLQDRELYCGLKSFMQEERPRLPSESKSQFNRRTGDLAHAFYERSQGYSALIDEAMPGVLRLSIHPRAVWNGKIPVRLVASGKRWATPWHNVAVCHADGSQVFLVHRSEAEKSGYVLEKKDGIPWRYIAPMP